MKSLGFPSCCCRGFGACKGSGLSIPMWECGKNIYIYITIGIDVGRILVILPIPHYFRALEYHALQGAGYLQQAHAKT